MGECRKRMTRRECEEKQQPEPKTCPKVEFCAGNQTISFDGECWRAEPRKEKLPDGDYSLISFRDGCIVGVGHLPEPSYTPNPCVGAVGGDSQPSSSNVVISQNPSNLLRETPDGLAVQPVFRGDGVSIRGTGTSTDPIIIALAEDDGSSGGNITTLTPEAIEVSTDATGATSVSLKAITTSGRYGNLQINEYGQVTDVDTSEPPIVEIIATPPLSVTVVDGRAVISLAQTDTTGANGTFVSRDNKRITVTDGLITDIEEIYSSSNDGNSSA